MRYNAEKLKSYIKTETAKIYEKMGLVPGQKYSADQLQEAYGKYLLEAGEEVPGTAPGFVWMIKRDNKNKIKFYGIKANGDTQLEVQKGVVGEPGGESKYKPLPKNAAKEAAGIVKYKLEREGWVPVDAVPESEESAYSLHGDKLGGVSYDDVVMQRGEAELMKRAKEEADRAERKKVAAPRGLQDAEGHNDRKIYGKKGGYPLHTGLKGKIYYPKDETGTAFQSKFKANQMVKMKGEADDSGNPKAVKIVGKIPSNPADKNSEPVDHTQNWHIGEAKALAKISDMIAEHIISLAKK